MLFLHMELGLSLLKTNFLLDDRRMIYYLFLRQVSHTERAPIIMKLDFREDEIFCVVFLNHLLL